MAKEKSVEITTGIGTLSFPNIFKNTAKENDKGQKVYEIQILIPKTQRDDIRALAAAIAEVGKAKWGEKWTSVRNPLRDGDKEADEFTSDGSTTKGEKYPERLGCYFINARSYKPIGVYDRKLIPIVDEEDVYGGCKGKLSLSFYPYTVSGNSGIGAGLEGVQKIADGESLSGGGRAAESMFSVVEEDVEDFDAASSDEEPAKKKKKKK